MKALACGYQNRTMDFLASNWVFILILVAFVAMHLIRLDGPHQNTEGTPRTSTYAGTAQPP